jgi:hypothetical protein
MMMPALIDSFRARLLLLLVVLLGLTLGVQYYVSLRSARNHARMIVEQEQAIMAGVALGVNGISSDKYLDQIRDSINEPLVDERTGRVRNVMVVDNNGNVRDSLIDDYTPRKNPDGSTLYVQLKDVSLPPLSSAAELNDESENRPAWLKVSSPLRGGDPGAFFFPVETVKGRYYVIVVLGSTSTLTSLLQRQASRSLWYTLVLLLSKSSRWQPRRWPVAISRSESHQIAATKWGHLHLRSMR